MDEKRPGSPETPLFRARQAETAGASRTAKLQKRILALQAGFMALLGIAFGMIGPYETGTVLGPLARFAYWVGILVGAWALWEVLFMVARRLTAGAVGTIALTALLMAPFAIIGSALATLVNMAAGMIPGNFVAIWPIALLTWLVFSFAIILPLIVIGRSLAMAYYGRGSGDAIDLLMIRLPVELRGARIEALQAEDHYVRIHTSRGDHLTHMRLEDAIAALSGVDGVQTHRSWWAACDGVTLNTDGTLATASGLAIPVSRRRKKVVMQALG
ncbi:LytTR family transcriptional regulator [Parvularcula flava]|nr:LytTR family DNA-binding domain-containing protein [Aquisalinus luteolus]NHK28392.1 LytTR family transcriptional regulator [Aquisalinus luteolus]